MLPICFRIISISSAITNYSTVSKKTPILIDNGNIIVELTVKIWQKCQNDSEKTAFLSSSIVELFCSVNCEVLYSL
jgi:hypothetical protein